MRYRAAALSGLFGVLFASGCTGIWSDALGPDAGAPPVDDGKPPPMLNQANCVACHQASFDSTKVPPHPVNKFGTDCATCHQGVETWHKVSFAGHDKYFPLTGKHVPLKCSDCHTAKGAQAACAFCHQTDYDGAKMPDHAANGLPTDCQTCHTTVGWKPALFDHDKVKGQPCANCHQADYDGAKMPDHTALKLPADCAQCHTTKAWKPAMVDHSKFVGVPCAQCHQADYDGAKMPDHKANGFSTDCSSCHNTMAWQPAAVDHTKLGNTPCVVCHLNDFNNAKMPDHQANGFLQDCTQCHDSKSWQPWTVAHDASFNITTGRHSQFKDQCTDCHSNPSNYKEFSCTNGGCHQKSGTDANHGGVNGYTYGPQTCLMCHKQ